NGSQPAASRVATANRVVPLALQAIEEGREHGLIQVGQLEAFGSLADVLLGKLQQQAEAITVSRPGLWACIALRGEAFQEKRLQERGQTGTGGDGLHVAPRSAKGAKR